MRVLIYATLMIVVGCQSQAEKDRAEMSQLINQRKYLNDRLKMFLQIKADEIKPYYLSTSGGYQSQASFDMEMHILDSASNEANKRYEKNSKSAQDSLRSVEARIEELKLLMGK